MTVISIDRSRQFNPAMFIGEGWAIWRGLPDGNGLEGDEAQDSRSLALTKVDIGMVRLEMRCRRVDQAAHNI
jgi:hypothetical protein